MSGTCSIPDAQVGIVNVTNHGQAPAFRSNPPLSAAGVYSFDRTHSILISGRTRLSFVERLSIIDDFSIAFRDTNESACPNYRRIVSGEPNEPGIRPKGYVALAPVLPSSRITRSGPRYRSEKIRNARALLTLTGICSTAVHSLPIGICIGELFRPSNHQYRRY
jgi:hypothetical protein